MIPFAYNFASLTVRRTTTATTVLGLALVVFVFSAALMLRSSIEKTLGRSGKADIGFVIRKGSDSELSSSVDQENVNLVLTAPGVKRTAAGQALGVAEVIVVCMMEKVGTDGGMTNVQVRGVPENVLQFRPETRFVAGRAPRPGTDEAACGVKLRGRFTNVDLDRTVELRKNRSVKIVGIFADGGSSFESEIWADLDTVRNAFGRQGICSSVRAQLESPAAFDAFKAMVEEDKRIGLEAQRETEYYEKQSEGLVDFITALGVIITIFFAMGAMIGAMITMYASVSHRQREFGTMRALGFSRFAVLVSCLFETFLMALAGGAVGFVAALSLQWVRFAMLNMKTWSELVFTFEPTPKTLGFAMAGSIVMGLAGGFLPALRAARLSPVAAMRGE